MHRLQPLALFSSPLCAALLSALMFCSPATSQLGQIDFPTSTESSEAQGEFLRGVLLLHSFEYEDAREAFAEARELDPGFAMAAWGEALTHYYPIWRREDPELGREALRELAGSASDRSSMCGNAVERGFLGAVESLFGEGSRADRWTAYSRAMQTLSEAYPQNVEAAAFYALSVLGTSFGGRDTRTYIRAASIAEPYYERHRDHPGLLHYLIHCYDDPIHAPLGLPMARRYDKVAPDAGHALHMPSHIYNALGMWQESVAANIASFAAGDERRERKQLSLNARNWHALQWLAYANLQLGDAQAAAEQLRIVFEDLGESPTDRIRAHAIVMRNAHSIDAGPVAEVTPGSGPSTGPYQDRDLEVEGLSKPAQASEFYFRAMRALAEGDLETAETCRRRVAALAPFDLELVATAGAATCCAPSGQRSETREDQLAARVVAFEIAAAIAKARDEPERARDFLLEACETEDAMGLDFGPPQVQKPAHEALAQLLLEMAKPAEARAEFELALLRAPRRLQSLRGLLAACEAEGLDGRAEEVKRLLPTEPVDAGRSSGASR